MTNRPFAQDLVVEARGPAVEPPRRKHHRLRAIVIPILLGGTAYGAYANIHHEATAAGASAPSASATAILGVRTAQAKIENVPIYVTGLGTVQPFNSVTVKPRVSGQISDIVFTEGQLVHAGDELAHIDPRPFLSPLHQAEAILAKDQAQLNNTNIDLQRITSLAQKGFATGQSLDTQKSQLAGLQATILADQAAIETARTQLDFSTITSPLSGVAGIRMIDAGNMITPSDPGLVVINQLEPVPEQGSSAQARPIRQRFDPERATVERCHCAVQRRSAVDKWFLRLPRAARHDSGTASSDGRARGRRHDRNRARIERRRHGGHRRPIQPEAGPEGVHFAERCRSPEGRRSEQRDTVNPPSPYLRSIL